MGSDRPIDDLLAWYARRDAACLDPAADPGSDSAAADDRLAAAIDRASLSAAFGSAARAEGGRAGEAARGALRRAIEPYFAVETARADRELARVARSRDESADGLHDAIRAEPYPSRREALLASWLRAEEALAVPRCHRAESRDEAARAAGAASAWELRCATHPTPPEATLAAIERAAIDPLDAGVAARAADRRRRFRPALPENPSASEAPALASLVDHRNAADTRAVLRIIRRIGASLALDPDGRGPALREGTGGGCDAAALEHLLPRPAIRLGGQPGPAALASALAAFGRGARALVVRDQRGAAALLAADPAFGFAAEALFRRLLPGERFLAWAGIRADEAFRADVALEEAIAVRAEWALGALAVARVVGPTETALELLTRAVGRPPAPDLVARTWELDPAPASRLRGVAFAVLLEERIRTRYGHLWFLDARGARFLRDLWHAEDGETAESVAAAIDLGTMEPSLIADGCRP